VAEDDGLTLAPILVEDLDAVLGLDERHCSLPLPPCTGPQAYGLGQASRNFNQGIRRPMY
jgi:hypothetical protein